MLVSVYLYHAFFAQASDSLTSVSGDYYIISLKYNSEDNFLKRNVYAPFGLTQCYLLPDMADKLKSLESILKEKKLKLVFYDCFRPLSVQKAMWQILPDSRYVANPKSGSNHNRGAAVDVGLADENGSLLLMPSNFDNFTPKAWINYKCSLEEIQKCENRNLLNDLMKQAGLIGISSEWWHFQLPKAKQYPLIPTSVWSSK